MSEDLFEKYLRNELTEEEARRLRRLLKIEEERRRFTAFLQEWTLLADVSRALSRAGRQPLPRELAPPSPTRKGAPAWWILGLAASILFMLGLYFTSKPTPSPAKGPAVVDAPTPPVSQPKPLLVPRSESAPFPIQPPTPRPPALSRQSPDPDLKPALEQPRPVPPPPKPEESPPPAVADPGVSVVAVAELLRAEGPVRIGSADASAGQPLPQGSGIEVAQGSAAFRFPDGSVVELAAGTRVENIAERVEAGKPAGAKSLLLVRGSLSVLAVKQPGARPMLLSTPHADLTVPGARFSLAAGADSTRLVVAEGRVKLSRRPDGASVEVPAGNAATAAKGLPLESRPLPVICEFQDGVSPGPTYSGTTDTSLSAGEPHASAGRAELLEVEGDETGGKSLRGLLRWDLSEIPPRSVVKEVTITLTVTQTSKTPGAPLFELRRPWVETEATWRYYANGRAWRGARSPLDRGPEPLGIFAPREQGAFALRLNGAGTALVQAWVRNPAANHGFLIGGDTNSGGFTFESRESPTPRKRPKIAVTYQPATPKY